MIRRTLPLVAALAVRRDGARDRPRRRRTAVDEVRRSEPAQVFDLHKLEKPWAEKVTKEAGGTLNVKVYVGFSLVNMRNTLDRVENGVADIAFCILGPVSRQFPKTLVATLPYVAEQRA